MEENKPKSYSFFSLQRLPVALLLALSSTPKPCRDSSLQALSEYQRPAEELQVKKRSTVSPVRSPLTNSVIVIKEILPMSKPIGYYTNYTPGDGTFLDYLQETYGATFERMTKREKLFLISSLSAQMCGDAPGETRNEIYEIGAKIQEKLPLSEQEGLLEALIAQIRWGQHEPTVHNT
jgi:hypothetical protein